MDSGNSGGGSLQSSSGGGDAGGGGDEVFNSRTESNSSFLNNSISTHHFNSINILQQPPQPHHPQQPPSSFFNPSPETSFSQSLNPNPNPMYNLETLWSRNLRPDSSYTDFDPTRQEQYLEPNPVSDGLTREPPAKNPKKRTRASRRAPTTVLTTDTTNFRQMVQEFTGIPAAPFSRRNDLYGGGFSLRPSAEKIQLQSQPSYLNSATANFQLQPSETHIFTKHPLNLSNLQNPMFPFQSLSQPLNATESDNQQRLEPPNVFPSSSSKRWRGQDDNLMNFEGEKGKTQDGVVSSRNNDDHDQIPGNDDSWI